MYPQSIASCMATVWLSKVGFSLSFGTMIVKMWRVMKIAHGGTSLQAVRIPNGVLFRRIASIITLVAFYLVIWTILDPMEPTKNYANKVKLYSVVFVCWVHDFSKRMVHKQVEKPNGVSVQYQEIICASDNKWWENFVELMIASVLVYGMYLAYQTRTVRPNSNIRALPTSL